MDGLELVAMFFIVIIPFIIAITLVISMVIIEKMKNNSKWFSKKKSNIID